MVKITQEQFIKLAIMRHNNKYDYSKVIYVNTKSHVVIICPIEGHGEFLQKPNLHTKRSKPTGCPKCGTKRTNDSKRKLQDQVIKEAKAIHGNKYKYEKVVYITCDDNITVICTKENHGEFFITPYHHINNKQGCPKCARIQAALTLTYTTEEFVEKAKLIHGNKYDYSKVIYTGHNNKVIIICSKHKEFEQTPDTHLYGGGCPFCINKTEGKLLNWFKDNNFIVEYQKKFNWCKSDKNRYLPFDFYLPELNLIVELDGLQHIVQVRNWKSPEEQQRIDKIKMNYANEHDISVIRIYQLDVWCDKNDWQNNLLNALHYYDNPTNIYISNIYQKYNLINL